MQKTKTESATLTKAKALATKAKESGRNNPPSITALYDTAAKLTQKPKAAVKPKAESKAKPEAKATPYALALYLAALANEFGDTCKAYYMRADSYHKKAATIFPRARTESERAEMTKEKAQAIIKRAAMGTLAAGSLEGQALYDLMKMGADIPK